jgi:tetratricopeptide (TPR) repeat protein
MSHSHPTPEQDLALARASLASGDLHHAASHLAAALASNPLNPEFLVTAEALLRAAPENAAEVLPLRNNAAWFGDVALHAWLLARTGNVTPAMCLLLQVAAVKPEVPYLAWAREWLASPDSVRGVEPMLLAEATLQLMQQVDLSAQASLSAAVREVLARVRAVHADSSPLMMVSARLARDTGRIQESLDIALAYERAHPDGLAAMMAGGAYRRLGDVPAALAAYRRALERDPENLPVWLDIGDMLWEHGRPKEALEAYSNMLAHEPEHPWALPSVLLLRAEIAGDRALLRDFLRYSQAHPDNPRALQLHERMLAFVSALETEGEPWVDFLPEPTEATLSVLLQIEEAVAENGKEDLPSTLEVTLSCPEAPSALLSARLELASLVEGVGLGFTVQHIPKPDPRVPWGQAQGVLARLGFGKTRPVLWRYNGTDASPAVGPPPAEVAERLGALAAKPFQMKVWREEAASLARELARVEPLTLAAVMVHPPPRPKGVRAWSWLTAVQMAAALVLAETNAGRTLLVDLLHGPVDWVGGAAAIALTEHALAHPTETVATLKELLALLERRPSTGAWCLEYPLAVAMPRLPGLPPDLGRTLKAWRDRHESQQD